MITWPAHTLRILIAVKVLFKSFNYAANVRSQIVATYKLILFEFIIKFQIQLYHSNFEWKICNLGHAVHMQTTRSCCKFSQPSP